MTQPDKDNSNSFRRWRMRQFLPLVDQVLATKGEAHILDVGGTVAYWRALEPLWGGRNLRFTLVNLGVEPSDDGIFSLRPGDARAMPEYADMSFDIVHSNSVIEHVGHWDEMAEMAAEVRRLAPRYFLQTPNMWFPVELHFKLPFIHWLPEQLRARWLLRRPGKFLPKGSGIADAIRLAQRVNLLDRRQMAALFPDADLRAERVAGLVKSWIAVREA